LLISRRSEINEAGREPSGSPQAVQGSGDAASASG
jgi:hypothetical protein